MPKTNMNKWEKACREWLKGCSCADVSAPEECKDCTDAFLAHLKQLKIEEQRISYFKCPDCGKGLKERGGINCTYLDCECGTATASIIWHNSCNNK